MPEVERIRINPRPNPDYSVTIGAVTVTPEQMRKEIGEEIGKRKAVYPGLVKKGTLSHGDATEQIRRMDAAYWLVKAIVEGEIAPPVSTSDNLFGDLSIPILKLSSLADQLEAESRAGDAAAFGKSEAAKAIRQLIKEAVG